MTPLPPELETLLHEHGAEVTSTRKIDYGTQYRIQRGPESVPLNLYHTGRISVGGKESGLKELISGWRDSQLSASSGERDKVRAGSPMLDATPRIGIDEAGKGDYFGPLVISGVRVSGEEVAHALWKIGVRDSKVFDAGRVRRLTEGIRQRISPENVRVVSLPPAEYEARRKDAGNVNRLLARVNVDVIHNLKDEVEVVVVDEFARSARSLIESRVPEGVRLEVRSGAEDDAAVAAASVLARARYLEEMERLSALVGFELPKGSTHVLDAARRVVGERGMEGLAEVAKVHFVTTQQVLGSTESGK